MLDCHSLMKTGWCYPSRNCNVTFKHRLIKLNTPIHHHHDICKNIPLKSRFSSIPSDPIELCKFPPKNPHLWIYNMYRKVGIHMLIAPAAGSEELTKVDGASVTAPRCQWAWKNIYRVTRPSWSRRGPCLKMEAPSPCTCNSPRRFENIEIRAEL